MPAVVDTYCTLAELRADLSIPTADTDNDTRLTSVIQDVSREIDRECNRRFYVMTAETRTYHARDRRRLWTDDFIALTSITLDLDADGTYETTAALTDYEFWPSNALLDGKPYERIEAVPWASYPFPTRYKGVKLVGSFGYSSTIPGVVHRAALIQCARIWQRPSTPLGLSGAPDFGVTAITRLDPDVRMLLSSVLKKGVV
jgi:hypothetical protein